VSALASLENTVVKHDPVMIEEVVEALQLRVGSVVADGTLGLGGHAERFIAEISPLGIFVGLDWDETMLARATERLETNNQQPTTKLHLLRDDFRNLGDHLRELGLKADAVLLDLGLNSAQIEDRERGISFIGGGLLDMRMDRSRGESAASMLNRRTPYELETILKTYGDEKWARRIAEKIVERRREKPLRTTDDLVECVLAAIPVAAREKRIHPATRTFQAVRIAVNGELDGLEEALADITNELAPGGSLAVLSYHSGEDRIIKHSFRALAEEGFEDVFKKPLTPQPEEISRNPRSRSAKLRVLRRPG
jgi:16S rRNA (cytosine1402-N4)-methyltransferase